MTLWHSNYAPYMTQADLLGLVNFLLAQDVVVTFNGANFDFRVLYHCTADPRVIALAARHVDLCLCWAVQHGYYAPMASFLAINGLDTKTGDGKDAIQTWLTGTREEKDGVLKYCGNDVVCLQALYNLIVSPNATTFRKTKAGRRQQWLAPSVAGVADCLRRAKSHPPNTQWMSSPPNLQIALGWSSDIPNVLRAAQRHVLSDVDEGRCHRAATSVAGYLAHVAGEVAHAQRV